MPFVNQTEATWTKGFSEFCLPDVFARSGENAWAYYPTLRGYDPIF